MARKSSQPALYELIRRRNEEQGDSPPRPMQSPTVQEPSRRETIAPKVNGDSEDEGPMLGDLLAPGRSIRVPIGYLFVGAAAIVALAVLAYVVGHSSGEGHAKAVLDQEAVDEFNAQNSARMMSDPLANTPPRVRPPKGSNSPSAGPGEDPPRGRAGPIESDPREIGTNYYYLVYTDRSKAIEFAEFCRQSGLEAYVVHGDNPELRRVMVVPGFAAGQSSLPEFRQLREQIEDVITRWKLKTSNRETLTYYPEKFKG